ncbi:unnamed protein product [Rhizoctonia solani]|uniref:Protein kinase domain-containing protein n=1 Tax=Rhizoctonia solani TaxID=456999 RepID=A0A8H3CV12_9AGAM|nr:unnamed protein product [Rhizoctonia solani]
MFYPSTQQDEHQTTAPARPRGPKTRGSYSTKSRPAMISTHSEVPKSMAISSAEASTDDGPVNWWEQPRGRQRQDQRASPIPIPDSTPKAQMLEISSGIGRGLPPHMRSFSPAPPSAVSDGPASPAALFLSAFSSPAPSVRSPSPLPSVISPAMAMFHSPPPMQSNTQVTSPTTSVIDAGVSVGGYVLGSVIGHGGFSTIRTATSSTTGGVVAVKIVPTKSVSLPADAPRGRGGNRAATIGRAATTTARGRTPDPVSESDGRPIAEEAALWSCLSHEHVLPLFSAEESEPLGAWFLFTLYCPAGTLLDLLKRDGQIISSSAHNTPSKRRPSFASSFSPVNSISRGRSGSITQPQPQRGGLLPETAATLFRQVVRGLRYLHEVARIVHRDIKLENVLVDENGGARITDFGLAVQMDDEPVRSSVERSRSRVADRSGRSVSRHRTFSSHAPLGHGPAPPSHGLGRANSVSVTSVISNAKSKFPPGSMPYAAPELLKPSRSRERRSRERTDLDKPNPAQDIWALGCVLHALFTGKLPFSDAFEPRLQMKIVRGIWDEGVVNAIPNSAALLETLRGCLCVELSERWPVAMIDEYAWAIGVADEEAEREAMRAQRGRSVGRGRRGLSAIRDRDGTRDDDVREVDGNPGSVHGAGLESSYSPSNRSVSRTRPSASESIRPTRLASLTRQSLSPHEALVRQSPSRPSLSPHDPVSPLTRQPSSPSRHQSPARPSLIPRPMAKQNSLGSGAATPTKQPSTGLVAPASTLEILDSSTSTPVPIPRGERLSPHGSHSPQLARSFSSVSSAVPPLSPGSDGLRSPMAERVGRAPSIGRGRSIGPRDRSTGRAPSADRPSRALSVPRTPSVDRLRRAPSTDSRGRTPSTERFSAKIRPPVDTAQNPSPPSSGPRTPEEIPQARRFASELEVVDEGEHHVWGVGVPVPGYPRKPQV